MPTEKTVVWSSVPEFTEALEVQNAIRDSPFILQRHTLCGVRAKPFSAFHYAVLDLYKSPFLSPLVGEIKDSDVLFFLWVVSSEFTDIEDIKSRDRFFAVNACRCRVSEWSEEISQWIGEALYDAPEGDGPAGKPSDYSWVASMIFKVASETGWSRDEILHMALAEVWQYCRCIRASKEERPTFINPMTDRAMREHWNKITAENN